MKTLIVVNPTAGGGRAARRWGRLGPLLSAYPDVAVLRAASAQESRNGLRRALDSGLERVISVGGDGTANLVVNVLFEAGRSNLPLGLVPLGTAADFARCLGLPRDPRRALERALTGSALRTVDAIEVLFADGARRYCLNVASAGLSGFVAEAHREHSGNYLWDTIKALLAYRARACRVEVDGQPFFDGPFFVLAMANARYFGKGMKVAPLAEVDDGLLEVVLVEPVPRWHLPWRLPQFLMGWHQGTKVVRYRRAERVALFPAPDFPPFDLDGEAIPSGPAEFRILPAALRLIS